MSGRMLFEADLSGFRNAPAHSDIQCVSQLDLKKEHELFEKSVVLEKEEVLALALQEAKIEEPT